MPVIRRAPAKPKRLFSDRRRQPTQFSGRVGRERRSATRPQIIEGWRKTLRRDSAQTAALPSEQNERVDVWVTHTDSFFRAQSCLTLLSEDDHASLDRLQSPATRISAAAARVLLRLGLSYAVGRSVAPAQWMFGRTPEGKPVVAQGLPHVEFSVSHIDQLAVVAVSRSLKVGIDVESIDQPLNDNVIKNLCHCDEQFSLRNLPALQRTREFIRLWTLKEAYTKMIGAGHSIDFTWIKFLLDPVELAASGNLPAQSTIFENFYITARHSVYHTSLAVELPSRAVGPTEVQIISLVDPAGLEEAIPAPISN